MPITATVTDTSGNVIQTITYTGLDQYLTALHSDIAFVGGLLLASLVATIFWLKVGHIKG